MRPLLVVAGRDRGFSMDGAILPVKTPFGTLYANPERTFVLGLDLSLSGSGVVGGIIGDMVSRIDASGFVPVVADCYGTKPRAQFVDHSTDLSHRIDRILGKIKSVVADAQLSGMEPVVFIEGYAMGFAGRRKKADAGAAEVAGAPTGRLFDLGELGGTVKHWLFQERIPVFVVTPGQLKKFATGKGVGPKANVRVAIIKRWHLDYEDDNICDAYVLARIGFAYLGLDTALTKEQRDVIATLKKG